MFFFFFLITLVSGQPHSQLFPSTESSAPTEGMLNPLWPELEVVMAGTSAEVPFPPDHIWIDVAMGVNIPNINNTSKL